MKRILLFLLLLLPFLAVAQNPSYFKNGIRLKALTLPVSAIPGTIYYNSVDDKLYVWNGTSWVDMVSQGFPLTNGNGTVANSTTLDLGGVLTDDVVIGGDSGTHGITLGGFGSGNLSDFNSAARSINLVGYDPSPGTQSNLSLLPGSAILSGQDNTGISSTLTLTTTEASLIFLDDISGTMGADFDINDGMIVVDEVHSTGLVYGGDYSVEGLANSLWIPDWGSVSSHLGGNSIDALIVTPTASEDGQVISWNDGNSEYELVDNAGGGGSGDVTAAANFGTDNSLIISDGTGKGVQSSGASLTFASSVLTNSGINANARIEDDRSLGSASVVIGTGGANNLAITSYGDSFTGTELGTTRASSTSFNTNSNALKLFTDSESDVSFGTDGNLSFTIDGATQHLDLNGNEIANVSSFNDVVSISSGAVSMDLSDGTEALSFLGMPNGAGGVSSSVSVGGISASSNSALGIKGFSSNDTGSTPVVSLVAYNGGSGMAVRPTLAGFNHSSKQWEVAANGNWNYQLNQLKNVANPTDPQDVATMDYVDSEVNAGGGLYFSTAIETVISTVNTPVKVLGTTTTNLLSDFDTNSQNNRLRYTASTSLDFQIVCSLSIHAASNNKTFGFYIAKNGVIEVSSESQLLIGTGAALEGLSVSMLLILDTNDYFELWVENQTDATNVTVEACNCSAH